MFGIERIKYLEENWKNIALLVLNSARNLVDVKEAIVYGSVIKGRTMGSSDLDIALVIRNLDAKKLSELLIKIHLSLPEDISELVDLNLIDEKDEKEFLKFAEYYIILK